MTEATLRLDDVLAAQPMSLPPAMRFGAGARQVF